MIKIFIAFMFIQIGTVLGGSCSSYNCQAANKRANNNSCGGLFQRRCTITHCCDFITNCRFYDCPSGLSTAVDLQCSGDGCSRNYCCRDRCSEGKCGTQKLLSNPVPYCGYNFPFSSSNFGCTRDQCCEDQQFCGIGGNDYSCPPSFSNPKNGRRECYKDCDFNECCKSKTCSSEGYSSTCDALGKEFMNQLCGSSCSENTCCGEVKSCTSEGYSPICDALGKVVLPNRKCGNKCSESACCQNDLTCSQNGFDGDLCAGGMDAYEGGNLGNTGEECCRCGAAHDCTVGCDPNWVCE